MTRRPGSEGLSAAVARHAAEARFEQLPPATVTAAKRAILDAIGVMAAASGEAPEVQPFIALASEADGPACVLGTGVRSSPALAALANGAMGHALDYEDAFDAAPAHPNASLIPATLALAQANQCSGRELIVAVAVGCDLVCRLGLSLRRPMEAGGWYPPPILGGLGAAVGAARILGLPAQGVLDALSLMLGQISVPGEIKYDRETVVRAVREAFPAQAAVQSAELARRGVRGYAEPLEGRAGFYALFAGGDYAPEVVLDGLGERWLIEELSFKPWPCCRGTHPFVEAALDLRARHGFGAADVDEIVCTGAEVQVMLVEPVARKRAPATVIDAKFSIPFTVAAALARGRVELATFADLAAPDVLALAQRVTFQLRPDWGRERAASGRVEVALKDGRRFEQMVEVAKGHPDRPLSEEALVAKFIDCLGRAARPWPADRARSLAGSLLSLERISDLAQSPL